MQYSASELTDRYYVRVAELHSKPNQLFKFLKSNLIRRKRSPMAREIQSGNEFVMRKCAYFKLKSILGEKKFETLRKKICDEYDYCNQGLTKKILLAIVECLIGAGFVAMVEPTSALLGAIAAVLFVINHDQLHKICNCDRK